MPKGFASDQGSPAHAGMDLDHQRHWAHVWFPRTRGDGPTYVGTGPNTRFPRTRGDGPHVMATDRWSRWFPPHTRGWTQHPQMPGTGFVFPASAGIDPTFIDNGDSDPDGSPRTRGDRPICQMDPLLYAQGFPRNTRG